MEPLDLRERTLRDGPSSLGDADLVAVLLGTGSATLPVPVLASKLLHDAGGLEGLVRDGLPDDIAGVGAAKRARLEAALELGRRAAIRRTTRSLAVLATPTAVADWAKAQLGALVHEEVWLLCLDTRHALVNARRIGQGGLAQAPVSPRDILRTAIRAAAAGIVLVHNHPSGDPEPSTEDARLTLAIGRAAKIVGLTLVDHVIVGRTEHRSLFEMGLVDL
jgi:DNA repair protein RadC